MAETDGGGCPQDPAELDLSEEGITRALRQRYGLRAPMMPERTRPVPSVEELQEAYALLAERQREADEDSGGGSG